MRQLGKEIILIRRVITGVQEGRSVIVADEELAGTGFTSIPSMRFQEVWTTSAVPSHPASTVHNPSGGYLPGPGETQLQILTIPPASFFSSPDFDPEAAHEEQMKLIPGVASLMDPENPGMHATPSIDYALVLNGSVTLALDDGVETLLNQGDIVVQCGARHAWRNSGEAPATLMFMIIGDEAAVKRY